MGEPWHSTCRPSSRSTAINTKVLVDAIGAALPFAAAEDALDDVICTATEEKQIDDGIKTALAKAKADGKPMPKAKSLKPAIGGATPGFADQGEGRKVASTHDNSV